MASHPTKQAVIAYAKRTAIGKMQGALSSTPAPRLGAALVKDAIKSTGLDPKVVDEIIMGNVLTAGVGQAPARQAAIYGELGESVRALTINRVCGSGLKAVMLADQAIRLGDAEVIFAGGQENMSMAPHLLPGARSGYRFGNQTVVDSMQFDGLWDPYSNVPMGNCGEICAKEYGFTREAQDAFAIDSYKKSRAATESGHFANEIVPIEVKKRREMITIDRDEEPFSVDLEKVPKLRAAFDKEGTITAANASSINDGAALTVVCSEEAAAKYGLTPIAKIVAQQSHAQAPSWFTTAPIACTQKLLQKAGMSVSDIGVFEINEAFAVVSMAAQKELGIPVEKLNPFGGAVSIGHPIGASGARILVTLLNGMKAKKEKYGVASICIGGGEASALLVEAV